MKSPKEPIIFFVDHGMIRTRATQKPLEALKSMASNANQIRKYANSVQLIFDGYEDDQRELYEIEEVRRFVQDMHKEFPFWFHFLSKVDPSIMLVIFCLIKIEIERKQDGEIIIKLEEGAFSRIIDDLFSAMNRLYEAHGFSLQENNAMTRAVREYLDAYS